MEIGRKIYYDLQTGNVILDTGERHGAVIATTVDNDISVFKVLSERNRQSFGVMELEYGQFGQDFKECIGYRVNPVAKTLEFSYPDPNAPQPEAVYQKPLTVQIAELRAELETSQEAIDFILMGGI